MVTTIKLKLTTLSTFSCKPEIQEKNLTNTNFFSMILLGLNNNMESFLIGFLKAALKLS